MNSDSPAAALFTAPDFKARAVARALPLSAAADLAPAWLEGSPRSAAVLMPVVNRGGGASVLLTRRADHLASHAGQIAFPGGKVERSDASVIAAALREAREEIGLDPALVHPAALLAPLQTGTGFRVVTVLAIIDPGFSLTPDPNEVAEIFEVPLDFLMNAANHQRHAAHWQGARHEFDAIPFGERYIWGATAAILRTVYERLYACCGSS